MKELSNSHIVIFDGVCRLCNGAVRFIIKRDPEAKFVFTPMQSELAQKLMEKHKVDNLGMDTFLMIKHGKCYMWSDAALEITRDLTGLWYLFLVFKIIPRPIRDFFYQLFARNRYKLFGRQSTCMVPTVDIENRFLGE